MYPGPLPGDPAPVQECALLVLRCKDCGAAVERWRPTKFAVEFAELSIVMGLRCQKCYGECWPVVERFAFRVPDGPVERAQGGPLAVLGMG